MQRDFPRVFQAHMEWAFLLAGMIRYMGGIESITPIVWMAYILYAFSSGFLIYIHLKKTHSIKSALKQYASDICTIAVPAFAACIISIQKILN